MLFCPHYKRSGHIEEKCYYKHPKQASKDFYKQFKSRIADLKYCNQLSRQSPQNQKIEILNNDYPRKYVIKTNPPSVLVIGDHDLNWYSDNVVSYYMFYNINDFNNRNNLQPCTSFQNDIKLVDKSIILLENIRKV